MPRSEDDEVIFKLGLENINMLFVSSKVLVFFDLQYVGRFWTSFELWLSLRTITANGLMSTPADQHRAHVVCTGAANQAEATNLEDDIIVTNQGDKDMQLVVLDDLAKNAGGLYKRAVAESAVRSAFEIGQRREWVTAGSCAAGQLRGELGCEQKPVSLALVEQSQIQTGSVGERLARAPEAAVSEGLARLQGGSRLSVLCVVGGLVLTAVATVGRQITGARRHSLPRGGPGDSYALAQEGPMEPLTAGSDRDSDSDDFSPPSESPLHAVARQIALSRPVAGSRGRVPPPGQRYARLGSEELL
ncbi:unnamed protein product [Prorocentrum cordatum]|uniref:Uncharacterized protein n=1 Tax=Prorocentrum cordatum TaxID=2364126 RepID=A0ABN9RXW1_9DINO|nr:unnamed protein product [Polarella glacialis]